jgi:hypothetical protein
MAGRRQAAQGAEVAGQHDRRGQFSDDIMAPRLHQANEMPQIGQVCIAEAAAEHLDLAAGRPEVSRRIAPGLPDLGPRIGSRHPNEPTSSHPEDPSLRRRRLTSHSRIASSSANTNLPGEEKILRLPQGG